MALELMAPADKPEIVRALARLAVTCARRDVDSTTADLTLQAYVDDMREYPADIVLAVLHYWPRISKWWPALKELFDLIEELMPKRRAVCAEARTIAGLPALGADELYGGKTGLLVYAAARKLGML